MRGLNGRTPAAFLQVLGQVLRCEPADGPVEPEGPRAVRHVPGGALVPASPPPDGAADASGPTVDRLDVSRLARLVLEPILGIGDPRLDARIDFVGGGRGLGAPCGRGGRRRGPPSPSRSIRPPSDDLMAVADAGAILPPKTTWFEPKLADGLVSLVLS